MLRDVLSWVENEGTGELHCRSQGVSQQVSHMVSVSRPAISAGEKSIMAGLLHPVGLEIRCREKAKPKKPVEKKGQSKDI